MQYTTLNELRVLQNITEDNVSKVTQILNSKFEKGLISEELHEKAMNQLDNLIEKAQGKKYIKRTGTPGNYKYEYSDVSGRGDKSKKDSRSKEIREADEREAKKKYYSEPPSKSKKVSRSRSADAFLKEADAWASELSNPTSKSKGMTVSEIDEKQAHYYRRYEQALKKEESSKSKHISDIKKIENNN